MAANMIGGGLPFGNGGASMDFSGSPAGLAASYANAYNSSLAMNQQNYSNILQGYQQTAGNQDQAQQGVANGYAGLQGNVLGTIQGIGSSQAQAIKDQYTAMSGSAAQGLIDRGLGNSTVANSVQRGIGLDQAKANNNLANQMANLTAGYQSNLGLAGLAYGGQAAQNNSQLAQNQLGWMNSVNAGYPQAGLYAQLAGQYGAGQQANADRALAQRALGGGAVAGGRPGTTSYSPGGTGGALGGPSPGLFGQGGSSPGGGLGGGGYNIFAQQGGQVPVGGAGGGGGWLDAATQQGLSNIEDQGYYDEAGTGTVPPGGDAAGYPTNLDWLNNAYSQMGQSYGAPEVDPAAYDLPLWGF